MSTNCRCKIFFLWAQKKPVESSAEELLLSSEVSLSLFSFGLRDGDLNQWPKIVKTIQNWDSFYIKFMKILMIIKWYSCVHSRFLEWIFAPFLLPALLEPWATVCKSQVSHGARPSGPDWSRSPDCFAALALAISAFRCASAAASASCARARMEMFDHVRSVFWLFLIEILKFFECHEISVSKRSKHHRHGECIQCSSMLFTIIFCFWLRPGAILVRTASNSSSHLRLQLHTPAVTPPERIAPGYQGPIGHSSKGCSRSLYLLHIPQLMLDMSAVTAPLRIAPGHHASILKHCGKSQAGAMNFTDIPQLALNLTAVSTGIWETPSNDTSIFAAGCERNLFWKVMGQVDTITRRKILSCRGIGDQAFAPERCPSVQERMHQSGGLGQSASQVLFAKDLVAQRHACL